MRVVAWHPPPVSSNYFHAAFTLSLSFQIFNPCPYHDGRCIACPSPSCTIMHPFHQPPSLPLHLTSTPVPRLPHASHCGSLAHPLYQTCFRPGQARLKWMETIPLPLLVSSLLPCSSHSLSLSSLSRPPRYLVTRVLSSLLFSLLMYIQAYFHAHDQIGSNHRFHQLLQGMTMRGMGQRGGGGGGGGGGGEGEGKERRLRRKADSRVTFSFLLSFHIQVYWSVGYSSKASEGRRACGGWWYTSYDMEISFLIYFIQLYYSLHFFLSKMPYY